MKQNLITVKATSISITADFEAAEQYLRKELKKYDVVVTVDTLKGCKKLAADLNKVAKEIDAKRKSELAIMTAPIKDFDAKMKSLKTICDDGRAKIIEQAKVFEDETRKQVELMLDGYRGSLWHENKVDDKFQRAIIDDLILLTNMTASGRLSGKAKNEIEIRVAKDLAFQDMIEKRLLILENASYKAGLTTPLEEIHVRAFLHADEDVYDRELRLLLDAEVKRQAVAKEKIEKETAKRVQREARPEPATTYEATDEISDMTESQTKHIIEEKAEKPTATKGNTFHVIQARFEVSVPSHIPVERIVKKLESVMKKAGITTLKEIKVVA